MLRRKIQLKAYGKINLSLHITGVRQDGMHELDMVSVSVDIADVITVAAREDFRVNIEYAETGEGEKNIIKHLLKNCSVTKAVNALRQRFGNFGADIRVEKSIPFSAGLGGSSADAAGVIRALELLYGLDYKETRPKKPGAAKNEELEATDKKEGADTQQSVPLFVPHSIGSDVPYMLQGGFCRVRGVGERLDFFDAPLTFWVVIAKGAGGVQSADAYRKFDELRTRADSPHVSPLSENASLIVALKNRDKGAGYRLMANALQEASAALNHEIEKTLAALNEAGADKAMMTGSGSACVGFFSGERAAKSAAALIGRQGLYARAVKTLQDGIEFL